MKAGFLGAAIASPLTAASFATGVLVCTFWGAVLATILAKKAAQPARLFVIIAAALTAVSLAVPAGAGATAAATKVTLAAAHILVAGIVIPILARHLRPARRPGPEDRSLPVECAPVRTPPEDQPLSEGGAAWKIVAGLSRPLTMWRGGWGRPRPLAGG
jgi:hypothetical protein